MSSEGLFGRHFRKIKIGLAIIGTTYCVASFYLYYKGYPSIVGVPLGTKCEIYSYPPENASNRDPQWYPGRIRLLLLLKEKDIEDANPDRFLYDNTRSLDSLPLFLGSFMICAIQRDVDGTWVWQQHSLSSSELILHNSQDIVTEETVNFDIFKQRQRGCKGTIKHCQSTIRIIYALKYYQTLNMEQQQDMNQMIEFCHTKYPLLVDDYVHIINRHSDSLQLEEIFENLMNEYHLNPCDIYKCRLAARHHRDRTRDEEKYTTAEKSELLNPSFVFYRDFFDGMHCHF